MIKKVLLAGAATLFAGSAAIAADIVEPAGYDWTGPYVGAQAGYGWGDNDTEASQSIQVAGRGSPDTTMNNGKGSLGIDGFLGGVHAGYNWQMDSLLLGVEGDIEYADLKGDNDVDYADGDLAGEMKEELSWLGSLRLRAGFAADRALIYATGGLAVGGAELSVYNLAGEKFDDNTETRWGWTIGGGLEYALTDDVSARIEYRYTDLGNIDAGDDQDYFGAKADVIFHAVRAGVSWHF